MPTAATEPLLAPAADDLDAALVAAFEAVMPRYQRALRQALVAAEGTDRLTMPQLRCLQAVAGAPDGALTTQLARALQVAVPSMTSMLDTLVERGLVERRPDPASRRQIRLLATPAGRALLARYQAIVAARLRGLLAHLEAAQKARLLAALGDIAALLDADAAGRAAGAD